LPHLRFGWVEVRLVAYCRVSEETEDPENQKFAIFEWAAKNGHQIIDVFVDVGVSGALPPKERPMFQRALKALEEKADGLVVYALDRIAHSLVELVDVIREVEAKGKVVLSVREEWLQQLDPKIRSLMIAIFGWAAEMERAFISERTREAMRRRKAMGLPVGRKPKVTEAMAKEAIKMVERGYTLKEAARLLKVGYSTLSRFITQNPVLRGLYYEARARRVSPRRSV
jgi:DNA invertase Pin-like site-specific DNA recombinase